jgi:hypothetical protein
MVATLFGAGQTEMLAEQIEQRGTDVRLSDMGLAVDGELHGNRASSESRGNAFD